MESAFGEHIIKCIILDDNNNDQCIISTDFFVHPDIHTILNFKDNYIEIQDIKLLLKVIAAVHSLMKLFLRAACGNPLEEIPEEERIEEIKAQQLVWHPQPSIHHPPAQRMEVTDHDSNYEVTNDHKKAFDSIKQALGASPFLFYPVYDSKAQFIIQTDTSTTAISAILYQESRDDKWIIDYNSRILTNAETRYSTAERECLPISYGFRMYHHYVYG
uniref:Reverse transcriptase/retrotransposon-derived protein RNase H-like domain-containing protein n=1 Tax=Romanomermis culicivorax TaxID=13658 RepID=A0A915JWW0_ROMCU